MVDPAGVRPSTGGPAPRSPAALPFSQAPVRAWMEQGLRVVEDRAPGRVRPLRALEEAQGPQSPAAPRAGVVRGQLLEQDDAPAVGAGEPGHEERLEEEQDVLEGPVPRVAALHSLRESEGQQVSGQGRVLAARASALAAAVPAVRAGRAARAGRGAGSDTGGSGAGRGGPRGGGGPWGGTWRRMGPEVRLGRGVRGPGAGRHRGRGPRGGRPGGGRWGSAWGAQGEMRRYHLMAPRASKARGEWAESTIGRTGTQARAARLSHRHQLRAITGGIAVHR